MSQFRSCWASVTMSALHSCMWVLFRVETRGFFKVHTEIKTFRGKIPCSEQFPNIALITLIIGSAALKHGSITKWLYLNQKKSADKR